MKIKLDKAYKSVTLVVNKINKVKAALGKLGAVQDKIRGLVWSRKKKK